MSAPPNSLTDGVYCDQCGLALGPNSPMFMGNRGIYCSMDCLSKMDVIKADEGKAGDVNAPPNPNEI